MSYNDKLWDIAQHEPQNFYYFISRKEEVNLLVAPTIISKNINAETINQ
jgi:hypothetical protein